MPIEIKMTWFYSFVGFNLSVRLLLRDYPNYFKTEMGKLSAQLISKKSNLFVCIRMVRVLSLVLVLVLDIAIFFVAF
jgi:hypothetical protein